MQPHPVARHHQPLYRKWPHPNPQLFFLREACKWFQNICRMHRESWGKRCFHSKSYLRKFLWSMTSSAIFDGLETGLDVIIENQINNEKKQKNLPRRQSKKKIKLKEKSNKNKNKKKNAFFFKLWLIFIDMKLTQINFFFHYFCITSCHVISSWVFIKTCQGREKSNISTNEGHS